MISTYNSLSSTRNALSQAQTTCASLVEYYLERIEATRHLNIYIEVFADEARQRANELDEKFRQDPASVGKLFGAVISLKDVICYAGHEVTAGSKILKGFKFGAHDAMIVISTSGIRPVIVEMAMGARQRGLPVIGICSRTHCEQSVPAHSSGNKLIDVADVVIDNACPPGDCVVELEGLEWRTGLQT